MCREKAAEFIKGLPPAEQANLAKSLGLASADDPLVALLREIAAAETDAEFDRIAQNVRILFGKEF